MVEKLLKNSFRRAKICTKIVSVAKFCHSNLSFHFDEQAAKKITSQERAVSSAEMILKIYPIQNDAFYI